MVQRDDLRSAQAMEPQLQHPVVVHIFAQHRHYAGVNVFLRRDERNDHCVSEVPGLNYNKGLADYHAKHNWVVNFTWDLPFARNTNGVTKTLLDGWQLAGISNARSGNPLTVFVAANRSRSFWQPSLGPGIGRDRASMAPGFTYETAVLGGPDRYFDPAAFALPPAGSLGNTGRGAFIGPNLRTFDLAAIKNTRLTRWLGDSGNIADSASKRSIFSTVLTLRRRH